jgi:hypothetical protein
MKKAYAKIISTLNSCETLAQLETTIKMIENFRIMYGYTDIVEGLILDAEIIRRKLS